MTSAHESAAAYVLGALTGDERQEFEAHLESCPRCQRDVQDFAPLPGLLNRLDADAVAAPPIDVADLVVSRVGSDLAATTRSRNRWRVGAAVLALAACVLIGLAIAGSSGSTDDPPFREPGPVTELAIDSGTGVTGLMTVSARPWGSRLDIDLFDMPARDRYLLWAVNTEGSWDVAASWGLAESGTCRVAGSTMFAHDDIVRLVVTSGDKADVLVEAV